MLEEKKLVGVRGGVRPEAEEYELVGPEFSPLPAMSTDDFLMLKMELPLRRFLSADMADAEDLALSDAISDGALAVAR